MCRAMWMACWYGVLWVSLLSTPLPLSTRPVRCQLAGALPNADLLALGLDVGVPSVFWPETCALLKEEKSKQARKCRRLSPSTRLPQATRVRVPAPIPLFCVHAGVMLALNAAWILVSPPPFAPLLRPDRVCSHADPRTVVRYS